METVRAGNLVENARPRVLRFTQAGARGLCATTGPDFSQGIQRQPGKCSNPTLQGYPSRPELIADH